MSSDDSDSGQPADPAAEAGAPTEVTARPIRSARIADIVAGLVVVLFVIIAIVEPSDSAGAHFGVKDQVFTGVLGVVIAAGIHLLTRPRLRAVAEGVHFRGYAGNWRFLPWGAVVKVEFPKSARFARLVLPGEEILALYSVQRADLQESISVMRGLRALHAASREQPPER